MSQSKRIALAKDFSAEPYGRYPSHGPNSGERFRDDYLIPALRNFESVEVDLRGTAGFGSSFLEEAFGGLIRKGFKREALERSLEIVDSREVNVKRCWQYIHEASTDP